MKSTRKLSLFLALALVLSIALTGCQGAAAPSSATAAPATEVSAVATATPAAASTPAATPAPQEPVTVNFFNFSADRGNCVATLDLMKAVFEAKHPNITINIETGAYADYFTQLQTRLLGSDAPDCFEMNFDNFMSYVDQDALLPLNDIMTAQKFDSSIVTSKALEAFATGGKQYALPYSYSTVVLVYNKDLFDKAGVAYPTDSWTWKDVDDAATKIHALDSKIFGIVQPYQFYEFFKICVQNGGGLFNDDMTAFTVNRAENVAALQHLLDRIRVTNIAPSSKQSAGMEEWDWFKQGRAGMIVTGIWAFPSFTTDCKFNWDISVEPGSTQKATHFFANGLCVNKNSKNADAAYEWINFLCTSKEMASARVKSGWELSATTYPDVIAEYKKTTPPANRQAVYDSLNYVIRTPAIAQSSQMQDIINKAISAAEIGSKSVQQALDDAQKELEAKIKLN